MCPNILRHVACWKRTMLCLSIAVSVTAQQQADSVTVKCAATGSDRTYCLANTTDGVVLLKSAGTTACILGRSWGYDQSGIWVTEGCSGEFATKSTLQPVVPQSEQGPAKNVAGFFEPYGSLRTVLSAFRDDAEVQDNATRIGIRFQTRGAVKVIAGTEWSVDLVRASTQFNAGASTSGGFATLEQTTSPVFGARLGYVGLDAGPLGQVAFGKQNSVHYDIASYTTDRFNVFGGQSTAAYPAGTDGGETGSGRADRVVHYSNKIFKIVDVGGQMQFRRSGNDHSVDGWGTSAQITLLPGLKAGGSYTKTYWANDIKRNVRGLDGDAQFIAGGVNANWRILEFGVVYVRQRNGDAVRIPNPTGDIPIPVIFDAQGQELFAKTRLGKFAVLGGFDNYVPSSRDAAISPDSRVRFGIAGLEWHFSPAGYVYAEMKLDASRNSVRSDDSTFSQWDSAMTLVGELGISERLCLCCAPKMDLL